jgi:hypothetical protein
VLASSRVRRHYLHHDYAKEKKHAWNLLGYRFCALLSSTCEHQTAKSMMSFQQMLPMYPFLLQRSVTDYLIHSGFVGITVRLLGVDQKSA